MSSFSVSSEFWQQAWPLVGWTMLWFLAAGTIVLIVSTILRVLFKRANPQVRYCTSLAGFAVLAILPILIAGYLTTSLPHEMARSSRPGLDETTNFIELNPRFETTDSLAIHKPERPEVSREAKRVGDERSAEETTNLTNDTNNDFVAPGWDNRAMLNSVLNAIVSYLPWLWLVGTPLTFLLLATGLIGAERLRKSCQTLTDGPILAACERVRAQLAIARHVGIAICHTVSSPLLIGVAKPLILLPPAALTGWTTEELEMVLLHELAHVRRWDNAVNLVQRIVESLLFFHPATWIMSNWVRRDREDCCDAIVVRQTARPQAYAELLLTLASHTPGLATSVAMAQHPIASRIRRILKIEDEPMLISRKGLTLGVVFVLATVLLAFALPASEAEEASLPRERGESEKVSRKAERVVDERSAEETTNPANDTNKDLATENTESTEEDLNAEAAEAAKIAENPLFPTLEEQRAADLAYKLLGVELEKLSEEDLTRVKAKGYKGGLRVTQTKAIAENELPRTDSCRYGDLLVGLHVWPTQSLEQVQEILQRDDLDQLSPLKFYVLRHERTGGRGGGFAGGPPTGPDELVTGRIQVDLDAWADKEGFKKQRLNQSRILNDSGPAPPSWPEKNSGDNKQTSLLYDGKTFDQWRDLWTTELKTEKRVECIKALAAFGRAGRGKEASEAIFEVAEQYDFGKGESNSATNLKSAISEVLTGPEGINGEYWLPLLVERLKSNPKKWSSFSEWVLSDVYGENVKPILKELANNEELPDIVRGNAMVALAVHPNVAEDQEAVRMIRAALTPTTHEQYTSLSGPILYKLQFSQIRLFPQQIELFLHKNEEIREHTLNYLGHLPNSGVIGPVVGYLLAILDDPSREGDHAYALHALAYTRNYFNSNWGRKHRNTVMDKLGKQLASGDDEILSVALRTMSSLSGQSMFHIIDALGDKTTDERREKLKQLAKKIEKEQQNEGGDGGMGAGGGMGGGGMY